MVILLLVKKMYSELIYSHIVKKGLVEDGDRLIVAVSAGPDSMCLLHYLIALKQRIQYSHIELFVVHVNHHTRGGENEDEEALIRNYCKDYGIPFYKVDYYYQGNENFHEDSRNYRYEVFMDHAKKVNANKIVLAHHLDDQVETVLFKLIRGANITGYQGMKERISIDDKVVLIRPFLGITKDDILEYCEEYSIPYLVDSSNQSDKYTRNKIRHFIVPELATIQTDVKDKIEQFRLQISEASDYLVEVARSSFNKFVSYKGDIIRFKTGDLRSCPRVILRLLLTEATNRVSNDQIEVTFNKLNQMMDIIEGNKPNVTFDLGKSYTFMRVYDQLLFTRSLDQSKGYHLEINQFKEYILPNGIKLTVKKVDENLKITNNRLILCYNISMWPLHIRTPESGDRIETKIGHKKVSRIFINRKIPQSERTTWPILTSPEGEILWVVGLEKSSQLKLNENQEYIVIEVN